MLPCRCGYRLRAACMSRNHSSLIPNQPFNLSGLLYAMQVPSLLDDKEDMVGDLLASTSYSTLTVQLYLRQNGTTPLTDVSISLSAPTGIFLHQVGSCPDAFPILHNLHKLIVCSAHNQCNAALYSKLDGKLYGKCNGACFLGSRDEMKESDMQSQSCRGVYTHTRCITFPCQTLCLFLKQLIAQKQP